MVIFHAVSSYQILQCILIKEKFHSDEETLLILPNFVENKFKNYNDLKTIGIFSEIKLIPYRQIKSKGNIAKQFATLFGDTQIITKAETIYVGANHFAFSHYLSEKKIKFNFLEDGCGILSRPDVSYELVLSNDYDLAMKSNKLGLFDAENDFIDKVFLNVKKQTEEVSTNHELVDFDVTNELLQASESTQQKVLKFFQMENFKYEYENVAILLTQQLSNLQQMSFERQAFLYQMFCDYFLSDKEIVIKKHPDDVTNYTMYLKDIHYITDKYPAELLPLIFNGENSTLATLFSSAALSVEDHFAANVFLGYNINQEMDFVPKILASIKLIEKMENIETIGVIGVGKNIVTKLISSCSTRLDSANVVNFSQYDNDVDVLIVADDKFVPQEDQKYILLSENNEILKMESLKVLKLAFKNQQAQYLFYNLDYTVKGELMRKELNNLDDELTVEQVSSYEEYIAILEGKLKSYEKLVLDLQNEINNEVGEE